MVITKPLSVLLTGVGGFLPAVKQIANVAALPGIVGYSIGLPDIHSGYGFAIGKNFLTIICCSEKKIACT